MTLHEKQALFARLVAELIRTAEFRGYEVTFGEAYRPPETAALYAKQGRGIFNSNHTKRLAVDLNLFRDGHYLMATEDYRELGEWWKGEHELARWGGDFTYEAPDGTIKPKPDGNHFSLEHEGVK